MEVKTARRTKVDPAMMADSHFSIRPMNDGYCQTTRHYYHHGSHPTNNDSEISRNDDVYDYRYSRTAVLLCVLVYSVKGILTVFSFFSKTESFSNIRYPHTPTEYTFL